MNKKISLGAAVAFALIVATAVFSLTMVFSQKLTNEALVSLQAREVEYDKFSAIEREVRLRYYGEIDEQKLQDSIAKGFLGGIGDVHAQYYTAEEFAKISAENINDTANLGMVVQPSADGYLEVVEVYNESPAEIANIKVGSLIYEINGQAVSSENAEQKMKELNGPEGSQISIRVRYEGEENGHDLFRRVVVVPTVYWEMIEDTTIAYVRIVDFQESTANQFSRALKEMQDKGASSIIFDVRSNENYEIENAYRILDRLVPAGPLVFAKYNNGKAQEMQTSDSTEITWPMAVVVNSKTAGTGEVFAQVLKDYNKSSTVGTITAGMGVRLETVPMPDGSAIKLTVAKYETPSGVSFDGEGITPDFDVAIAGVEDDQWQHISKEMDTQLAKAIEVVSSAKQ